MKTFYLPCLLFLVVACSSKKEFPSIEKGVSLQLAEQRKKNISDVSYELSLTIPSSKGEIISGKEVIRFQLQTADEAVALDFSTDSSFVKSVLVDDQAVDYVFRNEHIIIAGNDLRKGENKITIEFLAGNLSLNRNDNFLYTLFVPDRASTCFPLFDQPDLKASYSLTLKTPTTWEAVSNGAQISKTISDSSKVYIFEKTKPISSYLFAFAAGKFYTTSDTIDGRVMTMYYRETDSVKVKKNRDEIFDLHGKSISWLENYTDIMYPFDKFDFVLVPSFQYGGMEHPGSIFYNESAMLLDENATINRKMGRASLIAHETAHMWFGDLVTMSWFNDVWMKEVFANFMAAKIVQPSFPEINHRLRFLLAHYPSAYEVDRSAGANPILQPLDNLKNAGTMYGAIIYQKAPVVMRHLEYKTGEKKMQEGLQEYLKKFSYGNAKWDDLVTMLDEKSEEDIRAWSDVWVKTPGMPEYDYTNNQLTQKKDSVAGRIWQQPLTISDGKQDALFDFKGTAIDFPSANGNYFPNSNGFSYGYFKMDSLSRIHFMMQNTNADPVFKAAMWMNCEEGMLRGDGPVSAVYLKGLQLALQKEDNPLLIDFFLGQLQSTWWTYLTDDVRAAQQKEAESLLWSSMLKAKDKGVKASFFRSYRNIALSTQAIKQLEEIWSDEMKITDLVLQEEDKTTLAYELALKNPDAAIRILDEQLSKIKNPDRQAKMKFIIPSLSNDENVRDAFFNSLKQEVNREHEPWVVEALSYLHHPLRAKQSAKYLRPSLDLLQEVQLTGDIFFPQRWLHTTFNGHSSPEAVAVVHQFLKENPEYPAYLKNKILQSTDQTERAAKMKQQLVPR